MAKKKAQTKKVAESEVKQELSDVDVKRLLAEEAEKKREAGKAAAPKKEVEKRISFDVWYSMRAKGIPAQHRKEVIKADFLARGVEGLKDKKEYDEALEAYGIKL